MNELTIAPPEAALAPTTMTGDEALSLRLLLSRRESDGALQLPPDGLPWVLLGDKALRLERSARTFRRDAASTNYHDDVLAGLLAQHTGA